MLNKHYSLDTQTLAEWYNEIRKTSHSFREKYDRCFRGKSSLEKMRFYGRTSETYMSLNEVLCHMVNYGDVINEDKCLSCKHDPVHISKLKRNFERWYPWIIRCKDGNQFKKTVDHDLKDFR